MKDRNINRPWLNPDGTPKSELPQSAWQQQIERLRNSNEQRTTLAAESETEKPYQFRGTILPATVFGDSPRAVADEGIVVDHVTGKVQDGRLVEFNERKAAPEAQAVFAERSEQLKSVRGFGDMSRALLWTAVAGAFLAATAVGGGVYMNRSDIRETFAYAENGNSAEQAYLPRSYADDIAPPPVTYADDLSVPLEIPTQAASAETPRNLELLTTEDLTTAPSEISTVDAHPTEFLVDIGGRTVYAGAEGIWSMSEEGYVFERSYEPGETREGYLEAARELVSF